MKRTVLKSFSVIIVLVALLITSSMTLFGAGMLGDVNSDGLVNSTDYSLLRRYLLKIVDENTINLENADLNSDDRINSSDYALLRRQLLGIVQNTPSPTNPVQTPTPTKTPIKTIIKIMPLGDSITDGFNTPGGYRIKLWSNIKNAGYSIDFVGSQTNGPAELGDKNHEGYSGWKIEQIDAEINGWMNAAKPDIVLLHIGTNNIAFGGGNYESALGALFDKICAKLPDGGKLYVAKIVPLSFSDVSGFNNQVAAAVKKSSDAGKPVYLVDMYSALTTADLGDGVHPSLTGYNKMADVWFKAIKDDLAN